MCKLATDFPPTPDTHLACACECVFLCVGVGVPCTLTSCARSSLLGVGRPVCWFASSIMGFAGNVFCVGVGFVAGVWYREHNNVNYPVIEKRVREEIHLLPKRVCAAWV